jgi:hypothetical protein
MMLKANYVVLTKEIYEDAAKSSSPGFRFAEN